ncbi:hypothetical protein DJ031_05410 [bacterium endosymbiont of Escarpia laminata]|nr:MAG: hypothetical protein DJ031_05410 [bacterium endosymbiont of Escarpia laminata]
MMNQQTPTNNIPLSSLFSPDEIICGSMDLDEEELLHALIERIGNSGKLSDIEQAFSIIIQRKCCSLTYLLPKVAVFHARIPSMKRLGIALAVIPNGIECCWTTEETKTIKLVVLVLTSHEEPGGYMRTITAISRICQKKGFLTNLYKTAEPEKIWDYFDQADMQLPEFVTAGDIMRTTFHSLRDTDSLQVSLRPRDRFWDIPVPKIDSAFDNLFVPRPSRSLALRDNLASSLPLRCQLPMTGRRARMPTLLPLWRKARRVSSAASRLPGTTSLRFALHGWQRARRSMPSAATVSVNCLFWILTAIWLASSAKMS